MPRLPNGETKFSVLAAIVDHCEKARFGPTLAELADASGLTVRSSVQFHVNDLLDDRLVTHTPRKHRTLRPTPKGKALVHLMREMEDETESGG